ncbi:MAG: hypothetical protein ACRD4C_03550, partial [Candidatus Acidiferrales bacterium]
LGIGNENDRQPPIYTPPATQNTTEPNPPAGDPDPSDPFSGPVWQEINLPIQPLNIAALFGLQMPAPFVIDNWHSDAYGDVVGDYNGEPLCGVYSNCVYWFDSVQMWGVGSPAAGMGAAPASNSAPQTFGQFGVCVVGELANNFFGAGDDSDSKTYVTLALHLGAALSLGLGSDAVASLLPGPGWLSVGTTAVYDIAMATRSYAACTV